MYPILGHSHIGADLKNTADGFRKTLSAANQYRVLRHPISQSKNDLNELQTDNLYPHVFVWTQIGTITIEIGPGTAQRCKKKRYASTLL